MRKRNFDHVIDTLFWYFIYLSPLLFYLVMLWHGSAVDIFTWFGTLGFDVSNSLVYTTLQQIFGASGVLPLFGSSAPFAVVSWFINCMIIHLAVDFLLFIPRLCHKFMGSFTQND